VFLVQSIRYLFQPYSYQQSGSNNTTCILALSPESLHYDASSWVPAAAGNFVGVLHWFWTYKLAVHCIGWRPLRTA